ncbi:hypothetical protein [Enterocloster bolteae]|uniref:hypothetical protein n=1 Tax=Enterocloster bolteae TaxID=208479 RepID=UPI003AB95970
MCQFNCLIWINYQTRYICSCSECLILIIQYDGCPVLMDDILHLIQQFLTCIFICCALLLFTYLVVFRIGVEGIVLKLTCPVIVHKILG